MLDVEYNCSIGKKIDQIYSIVREVEHIPKHYFDTCCIAQTLINQTKASVKGYSGSNQLYCHL
jgi:hypothetical protein